MFPDCMTGMTAAVEDEIRVRFVHQNRCCLPKELSFVSSGATCRMLRQQKVAGEVALLT